MLFTLFAFFFNALMLATSHTVRGVHLLTAGGMALAEVSTVLQIVLGSIEQS